MSKPHYKNVVVLGLGGYPHGSGVEAAKFLAPLCEQLIVTDVKPASALGGNVRALKKFPNIIWRLGGHLLTDIDGADMVVRNPGVPRGHEMLKRARRRHIPVENDVTLFLRACGTVARLIGVTGTRGKTTTTHLIHAMLSALDARAQMGGNTGRSPLTFLRKIKPDTPVALELSSFLLHDFSALRMSPHIAVWITLQRDHLNAYRRFSDYVADKKNIVRFQHTDDYFVVNDDDEMLRRAAPRTRGTTLKFSRLRRVRDGAYVAGGKIFFARAGNAAQICALSDIHLRGEHNVGNVLAAVCAARAYGVPAPQIRRVIKDFRGVPYRLEQVRTLRGVQFINDTTATTPEGAIAGLHSFPRGSIILITGGNSKGLALGAFIHEIKKYCRYVIALPGDATKLLPADEQALDMHKAVTAAYKKARRGETVLLSPGLTWLPLMNEFARGDAFNRAVHAL